MPDPAQFPRRILVWTVLALVAVGACLAIAVTVRRDTSASVRELAKIEFTSTGIRARQFFSYLDASQDALLKRGAEASDDGVEVMRRSRAQMNDWLATRRAAARSEDEVRLIQQLMSESKDYFTRLDAATARPAQRLDPQDQAAVDASAAGLRRTVGQYEAVHDSDLDKLLQSALQAVMWMRNLLFVCVALLVGAIVLGVTLLFSDIVRPLRGQLAESEKLAALGTLAAGIAHEIRNPLTAIKARLYTLGPTLTTAESKEDALAITHEADRLERIVRDVLGYARPDQPAMELIDLANWLATFAGDVRANSNLGSVELVVQIVTAATVRVDANQLRQILLNLVRNALEALEGRSGRIQLRLTREPAQRGDRIADSAVLSVLDNGPGISPQVQARLFDPFFTTKAAGTGLGLSIVSRLVQNQGGKIVFESSPATGTCFTVRLPVVIDSSPPPR